MPKPKIIGPEEVGMLIDTTMCISLFLLAKICSKEEIDVFFEGSRYRLKQLEFSDEQIDKHLKNVREAVDGLKNTFEGGTDD